MAITDKETEIMRDAFRLLRDHSDPPPMALTEECADWWKDFWLAVVDLCDKHDHHTLIEEQCQSIAHYLERKQKGDAHES